jgi:YbgC/YbaW family acyl-CoA thioester hydrolase
MSFRTTRTILFGDCDPGGVIYAPNVAHFVVEATHEFLAALLGGPAVRHLFGLGILPPARSLSIEYLSPLIWDDDLEIEVRVKEVREHSFSFSLVGRKTSGDVAFQASLAQVCVSPKTLRPVVLPESLRAALTKELQSGA